MIWRTPVTSSNDYDLKQIYLVDFLRLGLPCPGLSPNTAEL